MRAFGLGAAAGLLNVGALGCLYRGLAIGRIGQVAPVAAVVGAVVPITWGLATGERPSTVVLIGVGLAVVAGALVSSEREERPGSLFDRGLLLAVGAGVGFGASFILFSSTPHDSGFWPVLCARMAAAVGRMGRDRGCSVCPRRFRWVPDDRPSPPVASMWWRRHCSSSHSVTG